MDFVLDKYYVSNELRMFLETQKKKIKFKNFILNFSAINSEDLDAEGSIFSLNFDILLDGYQNFINGKQITILYENNTFYLKFGKRRIRNKRFAKKLNSLEELFQFLNEIILHLKKQLKILDAFFIYFKDQLDFYDFYFEYNDEKEKLLIKNASVVPVKRKRMKGKKYVGIIELYFFYDINQFVIQQKILGPKGYKFHQELTYYILDENNAIKEFAEKWKNSIFIIKENLEKFELKYKKQKFLIKKL